MTEIYDFLEDLNINLLNSDYDIVKCLKKARYVGKYFNDAEILKWIDNELNGYSEGYLTLGDLPSYRKIKALLYVRYGKKPFIIPYSLSIEDVILRSRERNGIFVFILCSVPNTAFNDPSENLLILFVILIIV